MFSVAIDSESLPTLLPRLDLALTSVGVEHLAKSGRVDLVAEPGGAVACGVDSIGAGLTGDFTDVEGVIHCWWVFE